MKEIPRITIGGDGRVLAFMKFLTEEAHVDNFMAGNILLNPISKYRPKKSAENDFFSDSVEGAHSINFIKSISFDGRKIEVKPPTPGDDPCIFFPGTVEYSHIMSVACVTDHIHRASFEGKVFGLFTKICG